MPSTPTEDTIQMTDAGVLGRATAGVGPSKRLTAAEQRALSVVYSTSEVDGLLAGKAAASHTHAQSEVTGLVADLAAKADLVGGVIPTAQIPAIAISEYLGSVANQAAMLALTGDRGDWCLRSDTSTTWVLAADDSSLLASWVELSYPAAPVTSVNSQTGAVTLAAADVGAVPTARTVSAGTGLSGGGDLSANRTLTLADTAVTPGSYTATNLTVDAQGRITAAANGSGASPGGSSGQMQYNNAGAFGGATAVVYAGSGTHMTVTAQSATDVPVVVKGAASQSANLVTLQDSAGGTVGAISANGLQHQFGSTAGTGTRRSSSSQIMQMTSSNIVTIQGSAVAQIGGTAGLLVGATDYGNFFISSGGFGGSLFVGPNVMANSSRDGANLNLLGGTASTVGNWNGGHVLIDGGALNGTGVNGKLKIGSVRSTVVEITGPISLLTADRVNMPTTFTPASAAAAGTAGDICWDANYIYVCTATNTWKRVAIATW